MSIIYLDKDILNIQFFHLIFAYAAEALVNQIMLTMLSTNVSSIASECREMD